MNGSMNVYPVWTPAQKLVRLTRTALMTAFLLAAVSVIAPASAQIFPNKPLKIVVGFPPGDCG